MDLSFTDEQQFLREAVRGAVARAASFEQVRAWVLEESADHAPALALAAAQGWTGIGIPEDLGGQGGGLLEVAILAEELGRGAVPADPLYATLLAGLALSGTEEAPEHVPALAEGERVGALVLNGAGPAHPAPAGEPTPLVLAAPIADLFVSFGEDDGLELRAPDAVSVQERPLVDRTRLVGDVAIAGPPMARLSGAGRAVDAHAAVILAADAPGACGRMLELTVEYVGQRVQFGVPVGSFQAVKHTAAEMLVAIEGLRAAVQYAAWAVGEGEPGAELDAWVAKARAARAATFVADKALFLHGAVGYTWEHDLQLLFKRAKSDAALFGGAAAYDERIADALALTAS
jgi:alkylation response protein AidB-like acyl-CoA dehydrogenase